MMQKFNFRPPYQKPPIGTVLNWNHPLAKGLVSCWLFNEGAGNKAFDYSGNNNIGTLTNMNSGSPNSGWYAGNLAFDGSDDKVTGILPVLGTGDFTIYCRALFSSFYNYVTIFSTTRSSTGFNFGTQASAQVVWYVSGLGEVLRGTGVNFIAKTWYNYTFIRKGSLLKAYVDGVEKASNTNNTNYSQTSFTVGCLDGLSECFTGQISHIHVYNRALCADEMAYLYAFPYCMFEEPEMPIWMIQQIMARRGMTARVGSRL